MIPLWVRRVLGLTYPRPKRPGAIVDTKVSAIRVYFEGALMTHPLSDNLTQRLFASPGVTDEYRSIKLSQINYDERGKVRGLYLAICPGWSCNCPECQEVRGRDGVNARY